MHDIVIFEHIIATTPVDPSHMIYDQLIQFVSDIIFCPLFIIYNILIYNFIHAYYILKS